MRPDAEGQFPPMAAVPAHATHAARIPLAPFAIGRRVPGSGEMQVGILDRGARHAGVHLGRDERGGAGFPMVPGHEVAGRAPGVGEAFDMDSLRAA